MCVLGECLFVGGTWLEFRVTLSSQTTAPADDQTLSKLFWGHVCKTNFTKKHVFSTLLPQSSNLILNIGSKLGKVWRGFLRLTFSLLFTFPADLNAGGVYHASY